MPKLRSIFFRALGCIMVLQGVIGCSGSDSQRPAPKTVSKVDLSRYLGTWHQLALIPNSFQDQCVADTTATYKRRDDGRISVLNRCQTASGEYDEADGVARVVDQQTNAKLAVSFFSILGWRPVWGDYWILGLKPDYSLVLVGDPERKYGWILARDKTLSSADSALLTKWMKQAGYDPARFEWQPAQQ